MTEAEGFGVAVCAYYYSVITTKGDAALTPVVSGRLSVTISWRPDKSVRCHPNVAYALSGVLMIARQVTAIDENFIQSIHFTALLFIHKDRFPFLSLHLLFL